MSLPESAVESNLGLVHACCKKFVGKGINYDDLYSAGCLGLVKASERFNPDLGLKLSTYAVPVILGEIKQLFRDGGTVKVSRSLRELSLRVGNYSADFQAENGRTPTVSEIQSALGEPLDRVNDALNCSKIPLSLTADEGGERAVEIPEDDQTEKLTEKLALRDAIESLPETDRKIIELRYFGCNTQSKTAQALSMTQVQISRREKKILLFLREKLTV